MWYPSPSCSLLFVFFVQFRLVVNLHSYTHRYTLFLSIFHCSFFIVQSFPLPICSFSISTYSLVHATCWCKRGYHCDVFTLFLLKVYYKMHTTCLPKCLYVNKSLNWVCASPACELCRWVRNAMVTTGCSLGSFIVKSCTHQVFDAYYS